MDVEQLAVNKISDVISGCPRLKANIAHNDKTPFTDGHVDIYTHAGRHTKRNFHGRVPVQVKGRTELLKSSRRISFPISRTDLHGHLKDRGVLYFVVHIDPASGERAAYYSVLSPFKIDELLREAPSKKSWISVWMEPLPTDPDRLEALLAFAYQSRSEDLEMRASQATLESIQEITVHAASELDIDKPLTLKHSERDFSVVITAADGTKMPADGVFLFTPAEYVGVPTEHVVRSDNFEFRNPVHKRIDEHTVELKLSAGLRMRFRNHRAGSGGDISLNLQSNLAARLSDVGFFLACMESSGFEVDGRRFRIELSEGDEDEDLRAHFSFLTKLRELFLYLAADISLVDLEDITQGQSNQLMGLHTALVEKQEVWQDFDRPGRVLQPVGNWGVELLCIRGGHPNKWKYIDLFGDENRRQFAKRVEDESGQAKSFRVTPYDIVDKSRFPYTLNLRLQDIVGVFEEVADYPGAAARATETVLKLISAADAVLRRREEFLRAADELNGWIISRESEQPPHVINRWQLAARKGELSQEDRKAIRDLKRTASRAETDLPHLVEISCAILLGDSEDVEHCLSQLGKEHQEWLLSWPIWTLYQRGCDELSPLEGEQIRWAVETD